MTTFEAGTTVFCELSFSDRYGVAVTPNTVTMQILDTTNGTQISPETSVSPPGSPQSTLEIPISALLNSMTRPCTTQTMTVVIRATYPDGSKVVQKSNYTLDNPTFLKTVVAA